MISSDLERGEMKLVFNFHRHWVLGSNMFLVWKFHNNQCVRGCAVLAIRIEGQSHRLRACV